MPQPRVRQPDHLSWLTRTENNADKLRDGTGGNMVSGDAVCEIRAKYATGQHTHRSLGDEYGVNHSNISRIVNYQQRTVS